MAGRIVKISKGSFHKTAEKDISYYAQNINTNAGGNIGETGGDGIMFGRPESTSWEVPKAEFPEHSTSYSKVLPDTAKNTSVAIKNNNRNDTTDNTNEEEGTSNDEKIKLTIAVFFDGTGNNKYNTNARIYYDQMKVLGQGDQLSPDEKKQAKAFGRRWFSITEGSYLNDLSNVARLEKFYDDDSTDANHIIEKIYIEGVGTDDGKADSIFSAKDGEGVSGIRTKVKKSIGKITTLINHQIKLGFSIEELTFNVYGFSRGAATARNFVHEVTQPVGAYSHTNGYGWNKKKVFFTEPYGLLGDWVLSVSKIENLKVNFAGLFDTVSSHDADGVDKAKDKHNDIEELHLNEIRKANKTVHFVAENENRYNFSLTTIPKGIEKEFPGVHSDIGGCYETGFETVDEVYYGQVYKLRKEKEKVVNQSWFTEQQLTESNVYNIGFPDTYNISKLSGNRYIYKNYSFIFLELMGIESDKENSIKIIMDELLKDFDIYKVDPFVVNYKKRLFAGREKQTIEQLSKKLKDTLAYTRKRIHSYYFNNDLPLKFYTDLELETHKNHIDIGLMQKDTKALKMLRNNFLHFSADYDGFGMDPRLNEDGIRFREKYTEK